MIIKTIFKRFCLIGATLISMVSIQAECQFNIGAAASDVAHMGRDGAAGHAAACIFIDANRDLWGSSGCVSSGYYWDTETGEICYPEDMEDSSYSESTVSLGGAIMSEHPLYIPGNMMTVNWNASYPPPGMFIEINQWLEMSHAMSNMNGSSGLGMQ